MKRLQKKSVAAAFAAFICMALPQLAAAQGDPQRGAVLGMTCLGCHGVEGYRNAYPSYRVPQLGGQKPAYIEAALQAYRDRQRPHPTMQAQGSALSDQDIADIAAWIAAGGTARDEVDAETIGGLEAAEQCIACHGTAGAAITPAPPVLSGQYRDYLEHALRQYKDQERGMNVMNSFAATLNEEDIKRIAAFYSMRDGLRHLRRDPLTE